MLHIAGATLTVLATIGALYVLGEYIRETQENKRRQLMDQEVERRRKLEEKKTKIQEENAKKEAIKKREFRESEIKRILYGVPIIFDTSDQRNSWWQFRKFKKSTSSPLQHSVFIEDEIELKAQKEFREKHPFVCIKVPSRYSQEFLQEFSWLQNKTGNVPGIEDQKAILVGIIRNS